jgi:hypothetical protein
MTLLTGLNSRQEHRDLIRLEACDNSSAPWPVWLTDEDEYPHMKVDHLGRRCIFGLFGIGC